MRKGTSLCDSEQDALLARRIHSVYPAVADLLCMRMSSLMVDQHTSPDNSHAMESPAWPCAPHDSTDSDRERLSLSMDTEHPCLSPPSTSPLQCTIRSPPAAFAVAERRLLTFSSQCNMPLSPSLGHASQPMRSTAKTKPSAMHLTQPPPREELEGLTRTQLVRLVRQLQSERDALYSILTSEDYGEVCGINSTGSCASVGRETTPLRGRLPFARGFSSTSVDSDSSDANQTSSAAAEGVLELDDVPTIAVCASGGGCR